MSRLTDVKITLLIKLGNIMVHAEEVLDHSGTVDPVDEAALRALLASAEVVAWRKMMEQAGFLPKKRT